MAEMLDALSMPFLQRALEAGLLLALCISFYGVFIVQRGLAFMGDGLAHAAFGGVALGLLLGAEPLWVALPFTLLVALGIAVLRERTGLASDTLIGVFFALSVALGIIFLSLRTTFSQDAMAYLFGSIMAVQSADLWAARGAALLALCSLPLWGRWAAASFDRESARAEGLNVRRDDMLLLGLIAVTVVIAVKVVGIVLLSAFLVVPAAAARLLSRRFAGMTLLALGIGLSTTLLGLAASYQLNTPSGATIVLAQCAVFALALTLRPALLRRG